MINRSLQKKKEELQFEKIKDEDSCFFISGAWPVILH